MKKLLLLAAFAALPAHAVVYSLTYSWEVLPGSDPFGSWGIEPGDTVTVTAWYDTDRAIPVDNPDHGIFGSWLAPEGAAGISYTVNGLTWKAEGPMEIGYHRQSKSFTAGQAQYWGGPQWIANSMMGSRIIGPDGERVTVGGLMSFLPRWRKEDLPSGNGLMTDLDLSKLSVGHLHGSLFSNVKILFGDEGWDKPPVIVIPEPHTYLLLLIGLAYLSSRKRA